MRHPNFLIIGAMKAGTTALWEYLRSHPQVFMPDNKELQYFANPQLRELPFEWYLEHFAGAGDSIAVGEASTNYTKFPHPQFEGTAARVASALPDVKLIYLVRDPVERIRSQYLHKAHVGREDLPLRQSIAAKASYLNLSRYRTQLDQYLAHYDCQQVLVLTSESLRDARDVTLGRVLEFIGVDPSHQRRIPVGLHHETRTKLAERPFSSRLRRLPGFGQLSRTAPLGVKRIYGRVSTVPVTKRFDATIDEDLRHWIHEQLSDEVAGIREFLPPDFDGWGIA